MGSSSGNYFIQTSRFEASLSICPYVLPKWLASAARSLPLGVFRPLIALTSWMKAGECCSQSIASFDELDVGWRML
ncbi:hypothetical protein DPMN_118561 [Dreissena polymorpha]|uniref:Uncharacterized protein n=1 Tax=Dreissena polymorpha TaxID=45954 RepID=A0A9D4GKB6_DREPO|nr:hypothetical protein DPMN_118561 [Dreissena polymorpha]